MARRKNGIRRNRVLVVCAALFAVYLSITFVRQEFKMWELSREEKQVQQQTEALNKEIAQLKEDVASAQSMDAMERAAREKLKMVKSDEIVYVLKEPEKASGKQ